MKHKKQHYVPSSYLSAWCDSNTSNGQEPYVWLISRDGTAAQRKAPVKIFHENDLYTMTTQSGDRDLSIEHSLSHLESDFARLRRDKLSKQLPITEEEKLVLCMFMAAMYGRTKVYGDHAKRQWGKVVAMGQRMADWAKTATREELKGATRVWNELSGNGPSATFDDVKKELTQPYPTILTTLVTRVAPSLMKWPMLIIETSSTLGFITSDNPCVWFDPELYKPNPPFGAGGLVSPTLLPTQVLRMR
jgi:hypothetical protein